MKLQWDNSFTPVRMAVTKKRQETKIAGEDMENRELLYIVGENVSWYSHNGKHYNSFSKN